MGDGPAADAVHADAVRITNPNGIQSFSYKGCPPSADYPGSRRRPNDTYPERVASRVRIQPFQGWRSGGDI